MQCVHWGDTIPGEFEEQREFSPEMPYTIHIKTFPAEEMVPLHYAKTVEVLLCDGLRGEVLVEGRRFALSGKQVFVAPPHALHSTRVQPCGGKMLVFKVHPNYMRRYMDLENYLEVCGCGMERLAALCPDTGEIFALIHKLMDLDGDLGRCLPLVMEAFRILAQHPAPPLQSLRGSDRPQTGGLQQAVRWTEENYSRHVTLDEVARVAGYSKYYFCSLFRQATGMSYMTYLKSVRIFHACLLLQKGEPVQSVAAAVGFCDAAHFIQVFKQEQGLSPRRYALQYRSPAAGAEPEDCGTNR